MKTITHLTITLCVALATRAAAQSAPDLPGLWERSCASACNERH